MEIDEEKGNYFKGPPDLRIVLGWDLEVVTHFRKLALAEYLPLIRP